MHWRNEKENKIDKISQILLQDFELHGVKKDFKINKRLFADMVVFIGNNVIVVDVKPSGYKSDISDFMQLAGYMGALKENKEFKDKAISGCIFSSGTVTPAAPMIKDFGIFVTGSNKDNDIKKEISHCITNLQR